MTDINIKPYFLCRFELSLENECILRGHKVVIPHKFRERILNELHSSHFGVVRTKTEARTRFWWPNIDRHIEEKIGSCSLCNSQRSLPPRSPLAPWAFPARPWERIHLDMFSIDKHQFLVAVDAYSKWIECFLMSNTDSQSVINKLNEIFSRFGLVHTLVTDNATNFCSTQFEDFCVLNGIKHVTIAPYHPASNGQAENSVKTLKKGVRNILRENTHQKDIMKKINNFLFNYRNSTHCTTGFSPAQLLLGRSLRCRLDLLRVIEPNSNNNTSESLASTVQNNVFVKQTLQRKQFGGHRRTDFSTGSKVLVKHIFKNGMKHIWKLGTIQRKIGSRMYVIFVPELNCHVKKHVDQLLAYKGTDLSQDLDDISLSDYYSIVGEGTDRNMREETVSSEVVCQPIVPEGAITNPDVCAPELPETSSSSHAEFSHDDSFVSIPDHNSVGTTAEQTTSTPLSLLPIENDPQEKQISVPSTSASVPTPVAELRGHQNDHTMVIEAEPTVIKRGRNPIRSTRMKKVNYKL